MRGLVGRLAIAVVVVAALAALVVVSNRTRTVPQLPAVPVAAPRPSSSAPQVTTTTPSSPVCPVQSADAFAKRFRNDGSDGLVEGAALPRVVAGPAFLFAVPGGGKRSEIEPIIPPNVEGDQLWVHDVSELRGIPTDTPTWQLVLQWHQAAPTGSPPLALEIGGGRLRLANQGANQQDLGPIGPDDTLDVVLHVVFSTDPARGSVDVWRGGRPVLAGYHPPGGTMLDERDYLKVGIYRTPEIPHPSAMLLRRLDTGPTAASIGGTTAGNCAVAR